MDSMQPCLSKSGPAGDGQIGGAKAEAVTALGEEMEFGGDPGVLERLEVDERIFDVGGVVVLCLQEKGGRGIGGGLERGRYLASGAAEPAGIDHHLEVGARVDGGGRNVLALEIGVSAERNGEMRSGGEADNTDTMGVDVPLGGMGTGDAHGLLCVFEVFRVFWVVGGLGHAVFDQNAGDADGVEPGADLGAFEAVRETNVGSAGTDERRG